MDAVHISSPSFLRPQHALDSLSSDAAKTVKALRKSLTTSMSTRKGGGSTTAKSTISAAVLALGSKRCAGVP